MNAADLKASNDDFVFAIVSLDLARGLLAPMGLDVPETPDTAGEERLRELIRAARAEPVQDAEGDELKKYRVRVARVMAAVEAAFGKAFADRLLAWSSDVMRHPAGDPQAFLWGRLVRRNRTARTPPSLVVRVQAELARQELPETPEVPETPFDKEQILSLGFPIRPQRDGTMELSPMTRVSNWIAHVAFVRAWDKALSRAADPADETEAAYRWGKNEARAMDVDVELVQKPGAWPRPPVA